MILLVHFYSAEELVPPPILSLLQQILSPPLPLLDALLHRLNVESLLLHPHHLLSLPLLHLPLLLFLVTLTSFRVLTLVLYFWNDSIILKYFPNSLASFALPLLVKIDLPLSNSFPILKRLANSLLLRTTSFRHELFTTKIMTLLVHFLFAEELVHPLILSLL